MNTCFRLYITAKVQGFLRSLLPQGEYTLVGTLQGFSTLPTTDFSLIYVVFNSLLFVPELRDFMFLISATQLQEDNLDYKQVTHKN